MAVIAVVAVVTHDKHLGGREGGGGPCGQGRVGKKRASRIAGIGSDCNEHAVHPQNKYRLQAPHPYPYVWQCGAPHTWWSPTHQVQPPHATHIARRDGQLSEDVAGLLVDEGLRPRLAVDKQSAIVDLRGRCGGS